MKKLILLAVLLYGSAALVLTGCPPDREDLTHEYNRCSMRCRQIGASLVVFDGYSRCACVMQTQVDPNPPPASCPYPVK